jgi:hypothetical protein
MPVNQTSNNQMQTDIVSRYGIQKKQQRDNQLQQMQQKETEGKNNPSSEDVRVTLSRQGRAKNADRTANISNIETQQKTQENRNIESQRALQAYQNTNRAAENTRPENTRQRQINRIVG